MSNIDPYHSDSGRTWKWCIEVVLCIPQSSSITGASPLDYVMSYPGHSLMWFGSYSSAGMLSVYSTAPAVWAIQTIRLQIIYIYIYIYIYIICKRIVCIAQTAGAIEYTDSISTDIYIYIYICVCVCVCVCTCVEKW